MKPYALISVSDKTGVGMLASRLAKLGYGILSTSNTAAHIRNHGVEVLEISDVTGFGEILDGRVKSLHPKVHAGILADRDNPAHLQALQTHGIQHIDVVVVNLYPFEQVRAQKDATHSLIIENIDIGGPTLLRAAAKNYAHVVLLTDIEDYQPTLQMLESAEGLSLDWREHLAAKAFSMVSAYDAHIEDYFWQLRAAGKPTERIALSLPKYGALRYGENPHQPAAFYASDPLPWKLLHGKEMSYNNLLDLDSSLRAIRLFEESTAIITKHNNPCGIGSADQLSEAYAKAFATDPDSPFGGIVCVNRILDIGTAQRINEIFMEIVIAPDFTDEAWQLLRRKKNRRLISFDAAAVQELSGRQELRFVPWGVLAQKMDAVDESPASWRIVSQKQPEPTQMKALAWAWKTVAVLKSNAIAITLEDRTLGLGIGQTSRVDSTKIALMKARYFGHELSEAVCASDGFFPYPDSVKLLHEAGIKAIIQPGGSKGDDEVVRICDELGLVMVFTGVRHFRH